MKAVRRIVEGDLGLPKKQLDEQKDVVTALVDQVCTAASVAGSYACAVLADAQAAQVLQCVIGCYDDTCLLQQSLVQAASRLGNFVHDGAKQRCKCMGGKKC
jgi:hypothetical protein